MLSRLALGAAAVVLALVPLSSSLAATTNATIGDWSAPFAWPIVAVHMSLTPTGEVFSLDGFSNAPNSERLWNPTNGTFSSVPYGRNLFCSGHIQLSDGRTLIIGGHITATVGLADTTLFDPVTRSYTRGQDMSVGRWYPTVTQLPDGRVLTFAGDNIVNDRPGQLPPFEDASVNSLPEVYNPKTNQWTALESARLTSPWYPQLFVLSDGRIFNAGPDRLTRTLDPATWTWSTVGNSPFDGMSAVMYRPNKIMKSGAWADPDFNGAKTFNAHGRTAVIDMSEGAPTWRETAPMAFGRSYHNLTLLPDGTVLASGGQSNSDGTDLTKAVLPAEIWNPDTETWTTVDSLQNGRLYHSTALLLPDGRVLMAGGGALPGRATDIKNGEIYSPPYLFKGPRPTITTAPGTIEYGSGFDVTTPDAASIDKVSLIRLPSVTHGLDQNQRFQFLSFTRSAGRVTVQPPTTANLAPPGDYMLFLLNGQGVPSTAAIVRLQAAQDTTAPSAPTNLVASGAPGQVTLTWNAATDDVGVVRYDVHRSTTPGFTPTAANRIAQPSGTAFIDSTVPAGTFYYKVAAEDLAGNIGPPSNEAGATVAGSGPVASYGFDEGSGSTTADRTGNGNNGTLTNTTWAGATAGRFGNALSFNGSSSMVTVPDSDSLDVTTGLTLEAWVRPNAGGAFRTVVVKERPGDLVYGLYSSSDTNRPQSQVTIGGQARLLDGGSTLPAATWAHVAMTYDGTTQRLYVNGTQVSSSAIAGTIDISASPLRIGGNSIWQEWFTGLIDEVRVYRRALSAGEIQADMTTPITSQDATPPSAPSVLTTTGGLGQVALTWGPATDNAGVVRYNVHRSTTSGFTPSTANRIAQPTGTSYTNTGLAPGTYYFKVTAEDAAGNVGPPSNEASGTALADTTPPTAPSNLTATGGAGQISLGWGASSDAGGIARYNVHRSTVAGFTPSSANRIAQPTGTSYTDTGLAAGTYYYRVIAEDPSGNQSTPSNEANGTASAAPPSGLVAAYSMDQGSGTSLPDLSGNGNTGTISNATWSSNGRFGSALSFNGSTSIVNIPDSSSLDLTTAMTLEAWVQPTSLGGKWRTVLLKEQSGDMVYDLYAHGGGGTKVPVGEVHVGGAARTASGTTALTANQWTHLATTFDGTTLRVFVNGAQVGQQAVSGSIATSNGALRIGGNTLWDEDFAGLIDEVRIYRRALTAAEIQADMNQAVANPDGQAPTAPGGLTANGGASSVALSWTASTDNVGVARYNVHRSTTAGFTPSTANRIAQPTGTSYTDSGLAAGTSYYRVVAEDAAGNLSSPSNEASTGVGDTQTPSAPGTLTANGGIGTVALNWGAATDNIGVVRYNVHRSTTPGFTPSTANRIAQPTGTSYTNTGVSPGTYYYRVTAEDAAGNVGPSSNEASGTATADTAPPSAPTGLTAPVTGNTANLSWTASTDNVGIVRYNVHRSTTAGFTPSTANRIAQPTGVTYADSGLAAGTYFYKVVAEDAAGNLSTPSNEATSVVGADTTLPTAPTGLAANVSGSTVSLSWTAATDNIGVTRYNVHRSTTSGFTPSTANRIAQPTGTSYSDTGRPAGTYYYKVTAEDAAGNVGPASNQATAVVQPPSTGLAAAYGFDEGTGTTTVDRSGNNNTGTLSNATWSTAGKFGNALFFNGTNARVNVNDSNSLDLTTAMTVEAWIRPSIVNAGYRTVMLKEQTSNLAYALYATTDTNRADVELFAGGAFEVVSAPTALPAGTWSHLAATYDGSQVRLFVNGTQVASTPASGPIPTSSAPFRIGGNQVWGGEWFSGWIDEVRVYNRALSAAEIQDDMNTSVTPDTTAPTVTTKTPAHLAAGVNVGTPVTVTFNEAMRSSSITSSSIVLQGPGGAAVPATVSYDQATSVATLTPQAALQYGATYTATVKGGSGGVTDYVGNPLAADVTWTFSTEASPPQVLVVTSSANKFGTYLTEILLNEGLNAFTTLDVSLLNASLLNGFDVVLLGQTPLTGAQVSMLTSWVSAGGNLIAMRPDKQLAGLLGLTDANGTLGEAYMRVDTASAPGAGITSATMQFHGTADRYTLSGATAVATLYSNATTATANPAATLRAVGSNGGHAAAFTYDLARSVVYTRQGNPAWSGQERDGVLGIRPDDLFFGARAGDVQPDWVDTNKIAIPQADEQQRLLLNMVTLMERDKLPLPRFWYLPRGEKAVVVMSGDDHSPAQAAGGTASNFDRYKALSPAGCVVANWECVRSTSYIYPNSVLTNAQANAYRTDGFEVGLHIQVGSCPAGTLTEAELSAAFDTQLAQFQAKYTSIPTPATLRTHCVFWPGWVTSPRVSLAHDIRMDANYYHFPASWIGTKPGFMNGGGFPMRFADTDGSIVDVYQQNTSMNDEASQAYPATVNALLDNAVGPNGYYGAFGVNIHNDSAAPNPSAEAIVASAQARDVPIVSYKQLLDWVDGRNTSTIRNLSWSNGTFTFTTTVGAGATGLQTLLPTQGSTGTLSALTCGGTPTSFTVQTIKGVSYAAFPAITGTCQATYS